MMMTIPTGIEPSSLHHHHHSSQLNSTHRIFEMTNETIDLSFGASREASTWKNERTTLDQVLYTLSNPANHAVGPKDGRAFL